MSKLARLVQKVDAETPNTVLLVEHNPSVQLALAGHLSRIEGMRVETAASTAQVEALLAFGGMSLADIRQALQRGPRGTDGQAPPDLPMA